ncbi:MAG: DNA primase [Myxococcales bacterium]|nr:DNA primase [Myxococcales bacterium]
MEHSFQSDRPDISCRAAIRSRSRGIDSSRRLLPVCRAPAVLIPENKIEEILERTDLVALVSRHVELKKSGRSYKGCCPFHQEKTASFHVTPELRRFKCFGCQAGGDAIAFVQRYLGKTFVDAVKDLAREAGVDLDAAVDPAARERALLKEATDFAQEHFRQKLWEPAGKRARDYLEGRGVAEAVSKAFGLGYSSPAWSELADHLYQRGLIDPGVKAGLIAQRKSGEGYVDFFRGRLTIPIRSPEGRTIAFGARLLEGEGAKYINSRESRLYNKSETLYGMDQAREEIRRRKSAVLVEGYFDCIGLHAAGVKNAVALCSTALTPGHLSLLSRCEAKELVLLLDGDEAGRKAIERLSGPLLAAGANAKVATLPEGEDPDTFARKQGADEVGGLIESAPPLTSYLFETVLPGGPADSFEAKMAALERLRPVAFQLPVGLTRSAFFAALSRHFGLPAAELEASLRGKTQPVRPAPKPPRLLDGQPKVDPLEALFAAFALRERKLISKDPFRLSDELLHPGLRTLLAHLASGASAEDSLFEASPALKGALEAAGRELPKEDSELEPRFLGACRRLKIRRIDDQLSHIARVTASLAGASDLTDETRRLLSDRSELLALKRRVLEEPG